MILPDVNVLVHAHNSDSAVHDSARRWWDGCLAGSEGIGLAWATMLGFVRITTNRRIVARPLGVGEVMTRLQAWLELPHVHVVQPSDAHFSRLRGVLERLGIADQVNAKAKLQKGTFAGSPPEDHGEIGITQPMEILATSGFELAGWLPSELQDYEKFTWAIGITSNAKEPATGEALVKFLSSPTAAALIKKKGMEPGAQ